MISDDDYASALEAFEAVREEWRGKLAQVEADATAAFSAAWERVAQFHKKE